MSTYTQINFPVLIDAHTQQHPDRPYAILASPNQTEAPTESKAIEVSWRELHDAVHRAAYSINPLPPSGVPTGGKVIAIIAITDTFLYQTIVLAIARSGNIVSLSLTFL